MGAEGRARWQFLGWRCSKWRTLYRNARGVRHEANRLEDLAMLICQCNAMHRRDVVCGGGAAMFSAVVATLMGSSKPVKAERISGSVPELDGVAIRVVVDS